MAKIKGKSVLKGITGMVGKQIVFREMQGNLVVSNRPTKSKSKARKHSPAVSRFKRAQRYAKLRMLDPHMKAMYTTGISQKITSAHSVAVHDWLHPPVIHYIKAPDYTGAMGDTITIKATDDFRVASVDVTITNGKGQALESAPATVYRLKPFIWKYKTTVLNTVVADTKVKVIAKDYAGNEVRAELNVK